MAPTKWQWPNSAHIMYTWYVLLLWHSYVLIQIYTHVYIYHTSSNLYTPDSVSLSSLANEVQWNLYTKDSLGALSYFSCVIVRSYHLIGYWFVRDRKFTVFPFLRCPYMKFYLFVDGLVACSTGCCTKDLSILPFKFAFRIQGCI